MTTDRQTVGPFHVPAGFLLRLCAARHLPLSASEGILTCLPMRQRTRRSWRTRDVPGQTIVDISILHGKPLTLLFMCAKEDGDADWAVFGGIALLEAGVLYMDCGEGTPRFEIREEWLGRIRRVDPESRETLLNAEYYLPLTVGRLALDEDETGDNPAGLKQN